MKKSVLLFSALIIIAVVSAFSLIDTQSTSINETDLIEMDSTIKVVDLSEFGINSGLEIDTRTGKVTEFVSNNNQPNLMYMVRGYNNRG